MKKLMINALREAYNADEVVTREDLGTMTVAQMIEFLETIRDEYGGDTALITSHDSAYTFGGIRETQMWVEGAEDE